MSQPTRNRQNGFSLVELMIALVLGLLVGGMILQVFIMNNKSIVFQRAAIITQDQGRVALDMMARYIRMAGYQEIDLTDGNLSDGLSGVDNGTNDSISVSYQAGGSMSLPIYSCTGETLTSASSGTKSVNQFKLVDSGDGTYDLICDTGTSSGTLASNVEQFDILYGVDTDADLAPNRYTSATAVSNSAESMADVVAVKICMILASDDNMIDGTAPDYVDCAEATTSPTDQRIRRRVHSTITLRNRVGGGS